MCNRRKRNVKDGQSSLLDVRPNLRISFIGNDNLKSGRSGIDLTWQDIIFPTRVSLYFNECDIIYDPYPLYMGFKTKL